MKTKISALFAALVVLLNAYPARAGSRFEFEEENGVPIVYLNIITDVGAAHDPSDKAGLAYVANQMLLRGTQKHGKLEFFELLNRLGGQLEVDVRNEGTVIRAAVLSENLGKFLELVDEALSKPKFTAGELAKLKKEVEGAILEQKGSDKALVQYHFYRFLYGTHPYGNSIMGTRQGVNRISGTDVVGFYARSFGGKTLRLFGTGAAKADVIEKWFAGLTEKLNALHPEAAAAPAVSVPQLAIGRRALIVDKPKTTQTQVLLGGAGMRPDTKGFYAILLANHSYGGPSFQARMMKEIRVKRGWTYGAANTFRFGREPKHFAMYYFPKTEDTVPAIELSLGLFEDFVKNGITTEEYHFARDSMMNNAPFNYDTPRKRLENATSEYLMDFPRDYNKNLAGNIGKVAFDEIAPALRAFFKPEDLALTVVGDASKLKAALSKIPGFKKIDVKNYLED